MEKKECPQAPGILTPILLSSTL